MLEKQFENVFIDSNKTIFFFNFCDEFNINSSNFHIENYYIRNLIEFHFFDWIRIIYFFREFLRILFILLANRSFFYSLDELDISLEIKFWIILSVKFFFNTSTLQSFYLFEIRLKNIFTNHSKSAYLSCYTNSLNNRIQKSVNFSTKFSVLTISYQHSNHSLFSRTLQSHIQLFNQSIFFFDFCDVFNIFFVFKLWSFQFFSRYRPIQFESDMFCFRNQTIQRCHEFFTKSRALSTIVSISKNKIARIHALSFQWFRLKMIQETIAFQFIVSFWNDFNESIFFAKTTRIEINNSKTSKA